MTTTPTSGAADLPEALRSIQRFEVVDCIDDKHVPAVIPKPHGPWVRYEDHIAALAAGQAVVPAGAARADSVQEDAARYRWLREGNDAKHGAAWHVAVNLYGCEWDAAIDAARKQGATT